METLNQKKWTTFNGRIVSFGDIDQQHLSNIYYYFKYVLRKPDHEITALIDMALRERFNGQLLSYRPHADFKEEIERLTELGMLKPDGRITVSRTDDTVIGQLSIIPKDGKQI